LISDDVGETEGELKSRVIIGIGEGEVESESRVIIGIGEGWSWRVNEWGGEIGS